ncbi:MAG: glycosyltransferase, partial [Gordonia sp. (in: high G+C Gram-positive bacteria)]
RGPRAGARARLGIDADDVVVTFVGRIQPLKAPDLLVAAIAPLIRADPARRLRLLVVGGPSGTGLAQPTALIDLAEATGIAERVTFLPPQPSRQLADVYRASNLVAVPSYSESFGLVAVEAQACGVPVIAADVGGLGVAVADGITGRLVAGHDVDQWTAELAAMLDDPQRIDAMGAAAAQHAQRFSWEHTTDALLDAYKRALADFHGPERRPLGRRGRRWLKNRTRMAG